MLVIYAEKADVANKIAAALCGFRLPDGTNINFKNLAANKKAVEAFQKKQGYLDITFKGEPCKVTWGYGHLYGLKDVFGYDPALKSWKNRPSCFVPDRFELQPTSSNLPAFEKLLNQQRNVAKRLLNSADHIINATDDDREGELIFAYVCEASGCRKPFQRVHFTSQTESGIKEAFDHLIPSSAVKSVEMAGRARSIYDWLIGTNLTTRMTLKIGDGEVWSVGRVQTLVLKMLGDREKAIRDFVPSPFWNIKAVFTTDDGKQYAGTYKEEKIKDKAKAEAVLAAVKGQDGKIVDVKNKTTHKEVPLLYSQTALQIDANKAYGYPAKDTLRIAQSLYDNGYVTYPRTKSTYLNDDMRPTVISVLEALSKTARYGPYLTGKSLTPDGKFFNSKKVESHFAIIPTWTIPSSLSKEEQNIYDLICYSVIRTIYPDATLSNTTVATDVKGYLFLSKGTAIIDPGWMAVAYKSRETLLPALKTGEHVTGKYENKEGKTEPPKRYDDASLVAAMRTAGKDLEDEELRKILSDPKVEGIGTEATRADIIETLVRRKYAERTGKSFVVTEKGMQLLNQLPAIDMLSPEFTARMEQKLSAIENGTLAYDDFLREVTHQTKEWCAAVDALKVPTPKTSSGMTYCAPPLDEDELSSAIPAKPKGPQAIGNCPMCGQPVLSSRKGYFCKGQPDCRFAIGKTICSHAITDGEVKALLTKGKTRLIKDFVSKKTGNSFSARLTLDDSDGSIHFSYD